MVKKGKKYRTRGGREVRIYATNGGGMKPIHGAIRQNKHTWFIFHWHEDGKASHYHHTKDDDLVEDQGG
jgi:hypothetical protein